MECYNVSTTDSCTCQKCKSKNAGYVDFKSTNGIVIRIPCCDNCYEYMRDTLFDYARKELSSIKSVLDIRKKIKFVEARDNANEEN
jgi:hypothetical protein